MQSNTEWMMAFIPTIAGAVVIIFALMSSTPWMTDVFLRIITLSTMVGNFIKNAMSFMQYLSST